jgi:putative hydrolase of the HAD superfamily
VNAIRAVITDFGGVLTRPLIEAFTMANESAGVPLEALGAAMVRMAREDGENPLHELEKGQVAVADFLARLGREISAELGREVRLDGFGERYFEHLHPNEPMIALMRDLRERGLRLAILTNNVREWEPLWRAKVPVDEIFDLVIDSAFVGMRKPEPAIFQLTIERLGVPARACLFVDDVEANCDAARALGMRTVWFRSDRQAIAEVQAALGEDAAGGARPE